MDVDNAVIENKVVEPMQSGVATDNEMLESTQTNGYSQISSSTSSSDNILSPDMSHAKYLHVDYVAIGNEVLDTMKTGGLFKFLHLPLLCHGQMRNLHMKMSNRKCLIWLMWHLRRIC